MKDIGRFMVYNAQISETGDFELANKLLGRATTTLQDWCQMEVNKLQAQPAFA